MHGLNFVFLSRKGMADMPVVWIPSLLRPLAGGQETVTAEGDTVGQVMESLEQRYPGIQARLFKGDRLRPSLSLLVDGELSTRGLLQKVGQESEIRFIPAIHGGSGVGAKHPAPNE
jgi:molybdopterin converting factor small subunit